MMLLITSLISCDPQKRINKDYNYFQKGADSITRVEYTEYKFVANDLISIQVIAGTLRQEDASLFNLSSGGNNNSITGATVGSTTGVSMPLPTQTIAPTYQIDLQGYIEMPKIGKIKALGLTKQELADLIKEKLADEVKSPLVIIKFVQFKANVLGEVRRPGVVNFGSDKANILDALAEAGDLNEYGKREDILLMRKKDGKYETYRIDLRNTSFINSPAFQIQPNDIIYVGANTNKLKTINVNPNFQRDYSLALTTISTLFLIVSTLALAKGRL